MFANLLPATRNILIANVVAFLAQLLVPGLLENYFALWPLGDGFRFWQLLTYAFLHGGVAHIVFNMIGLMSFGSPLEYAWGEKRLYTFYIVSCITAAMTQLLVGVIMGQAGLTIGASGGVFGLLLGYAVLFPRQRVMLLFPPIPMPAWFFAFAYGSVELFLGFTNRDAGVAHFAHLGGMLGGGLLLFVWHRQRLLQ